MNKTKNILFAVFILNLQPAFSEEEKKGLSAEAGTEAGAVCLDQNCPSTQTSLQNLQSTTNDQLCSYTQERPECKGVRKDHLKGCMDFSGISKKAIETGKGVGQCVMGLGSGLAQAMITIFKMFFPDEDTQEDIKAYLHGEFENASQDSGTTMAVLKSAGSILELFYDSMSDVYSCLNPVGVTRKVCQLIPAGVVTGVTGASTAALVGGLALVVGPTAGLIGGVNLLENKLDMEDKNELLIPILAVPAVLAGVGAGAVISKVAVSPFTVKALAVASIPFGIAASTGAMAIHDKEVRERVKEKIKGRIELFKALEDLKKLEEEKK